MLGMLPVTKASRNNVTSAASENDKAWMYARPRRVSRNLFMYARPCPLYAINRSCFVADGACSDRTVVRRSSRQSPTGWIDVLHSRDFRFARNHWSRRNFPSLAKSILNVRIYDRKPRTSDVAELWTHSRQRKVTGIFFSPADRCTIGQTSERIKSDLSFSREQNWKTCLPIITAGRRGERGEKGTACAIAMMAMDVGFADSLADRDLYLRNLRRDKR